MASAKNKSSCGDKLQAGVLFACSRELGSDNRACSWEIMEWAEISQGSPLVPRHLEDSPLPNVFVVPVLLPPVFAEILTSHLQFCNKSLCKGTWNVVD